MIKTLLFTTLLFTSSNVLCQSIPIKSIERRDGNVRQTISAGVKAPPFKIEDISGTLIIFPTKKLTLLEFWGTWCKPCIEELPFLQDVYDFYSSENFEIVGIANDSQNNVSRFIKTNPISWNQISTNYRSEENILSAYKVTSFPSLFLVGGDGIVLEETSSLRHYSLYQEVAKHLDQDPQLFLYYIMEGEVRLMVPKSDFATVLIKAGELTERNKFLYEYNGSFVRGFSWPDGVEQVSVTMVIEHHDYKKEIRNLTLYRNQIIHGRIDLSLKYIN